MKDNDLSVDIFAQSNSNVEVPSETIYEYDMALESPAKYISEYKPKNIVITDKEARVVKSLQSAFEPQKSSMVGTLAYSAGEVVRQTLEAPRQFSNAVELGKAYLEDTFYPNAEDSALRRWADNVGKIEAERQKASGELVSQEVGHPMIYVIGTAVGNAARDIFLAGGAAKLGANYATTTAIKKAAEKTISKEVATRYTQMAAAEGAKKAGTAAIESSVFAQTFGESTIDDVSQYIEKTGDYDLKNYDPGVDLATNIAIGGLSAKIEKGLGFERYVPRMVAEATKQSKKIPALKQIAIRSAEGGVGEISEEELQEGLSQFGEMVKGYREWWDWDVDRFITAAVAAGTVGTGASASLHYINRMAAIRRLEANGLDKNTATEVVDTILSNEINKTLNDLSAATELQTQEGQAYEKLKTSIKSALETPGIAENLVDQTTGKPLNLDEYSSVVARDISRQVIKQSVESGLPIDTILDIASFANINNVLYLRPLGTAEDIQKRIAEQDAIIARQKELKKTGAGNNKVLENARIKRNFLQNAYIQARVRSEIAKVQIEEAKTPEITQEINNADTDATQLTKTETKTEFDANLDPNLTTAEKDKRFGNAVIKKIFGKNKFEFDSVMTLPQYTEARNGIIASANRIFEFAKAHRTYGIYTDIRNALNRMQTVNQFNFIDSVTTPNLDGVDVVAENAFLYHFIFSDAPTISAYIDAYLQRAEASITGGTQTSLSKKDLVGQAFKATDDLMQVQAESAGIEYTSIYDSTGALADKNVMAVLVSYQNQFLSEEPRVQTIEYSDSEVLGIFAKAKNNGDITLDNWENVRWSSLLSAGDTYQKGKRNKPATEADKAKFARKMLDKYLPNWNKPTQQLLEQFDLADENARLDDIYPAYDGETIEVDGKERTVYNSNGERIAKSAESLTNFWRWFGDSKVVDEQGRPIIVYHGSLWNFKEFKGGEYNFSFSWNFARNYAETKSFEQGLDREAQVYEVYLKSEKPFDFRNPKDIDDLIKAIGNKKVDLLGTPKTTEDIIEDITGKYLSNGISQEEFDRVKENSTYDKYNYKVDSGLAGNDPIVYKTDDYFVYVDYVGSIRREIYDSFPIYTDKKKIIDTLKNNPELNVFDGDTKDIQVETDVTDYNVRDKDGNPEVRQVKIDVTLKKIHSPKTATIKYDADNWFFIENTRIDGVDFVDFLTNLGYDSYYKQEDGVLNIAIRPQTNYQQIKSVDNRGTYSEKTGNIYSQGRTVNGFYDPELAVIVLGRNMNEMTLPHEMAHYWLDTIFNIYQRVQSGELKVKESWLQSTKDLFNMVGIDQNQTQLTKGQHEKFARMTEAYLTGFGIPTGANQTFKEYLKWIPAKYKSIAQLAYLDDKGKIQLPFLDQAAVDFFNRWYENPSLPSLESSPERERFINVTDDKGDTIQVSIKEMNDREKEFGQDAEEQERTDQRLYNTLDENMPADVKPTADAQKVVIAERGNFLKDSEQQQRRWFERKSRDTEAQLAQDYIEKNPEHAKEVIYGDPELVPNDTGIDRATLINAYMALNNITPKDEDWARLHTNIAINQSLAGTQLALSNDKSYQTYLDALREIESALELKAATNYAGSKRGAIERFNRDIQRFLDRELPSIFATEPNTKERETALRVMFEKARTTFSGNTTGGFLNQEDLNFAQSQKGNSEVFIRWAMNQIKKDAGAKLNNEQQAKLLDISAKAQQALIDIDNPESAKAVAAAQELRKWQLEKQKMMGVSAKKFSLFGDYAPRAMLASINTLFFANVPSTAMNTLATRLATRGWTGGIFGENNVSQNLIDNEVKRIKEIYGATSMNLAQMEKPTSPSLLHGEKYSASGQKWYDPYTILGKEDNLFRVPTFVNTLARIASTDAKATGRSADEVFKEYLQLNNQTDAAKLARKQALAVANMAVFTQDGALASCLNHIRSELNKVSRVMLGLDPKGFGLGNLLAPFLTTGANIAEMGIRGSIAPIIQLATWANQLRTGKALDPMKKLALRMDWTYFTMSALAMVLLAALTSDDDEFYTDPYRTGVKYDPNKPYDSINIAGVWVDLDFFGAFAIPMRTAAMAIRQWKKDNNIGSAITKGYAGSAKNVIGDIPLVESIVNNQFEWATKQPGSWASTYLYTQANKLVPAQIKPTSRAISRGMGWEYEGEWLGKVGRKFHRNYGFDGAELTTQDLIEILTIKAQLGKDSEKFMNSILGL